MHVSERLLQLYAKLDRQTRDVVQQRIEKNLAAGKSLAASYHELTGETNDSLSVEEKSATDFSNWLKEGKTDLDLLTYYVALLEKSEMLQSEVVMPQTIGPTPPPLVEPVVPKAMTSEEKVESEAETPIDPTPTKPRYVPESTIPSRTERMKSHREIKPARPLKKKSRGWLIGLLAIILLSVGGYVAYPMISDLFEPSSTPTVTKEPATPEPEPVAETKVLEEVWIGVKHTPLLSEPNSEDVVYVADIGDRYDVLEERDDALFLDLGVNNLTGWVSRDEVVTEWSGLSISDPDLLKWLTVGVDQVYLYEPAEAYLEMTRDQLVEVVGEPYGLDSDDLNEYLIYNGIFFTIQNGRVEAIDWPSTIQTKEMFLKLGEPTYEIEDGVVYESQNYSLRLFVKENESTRVRVTKLDN
ncbi:hypothetical protein ACFQO8_01825 [Exiguobacterium aestuarii]|uniref:Uncharacterized protein n=1 Tax=Exiguobacterium aestuarii TaxID=273527 RepID=A0ABW2PH87_9BACL|nr:MULTISPECIES: hypothetical protein [Exiguobacterium]MCT4785113.1 hypothetical protein [Exiguobacterium aestuarii]